MSDSRLRVEDLEKSFTVGGLFSGLGGRQRLRAVRGVSFSIESGSTLGLVGESGCGKSTLGKTLVRLYDPDGGQFFLNGQDLSSLSQKELKPHRRKIQMIFQDPYSSLNPRHRIREVLAEPFIIHGERDRVTDENLISLLETVGLESSALDRFPHEFSGGQRQRIGIARAIALDPEIIIADEPVSALDVSVQAQILTLLCELRDKLGLSYLFISHDLAVVEYISDRVAVMYLGEIVEMADTEDLYTHPRHPYTRLLMEAIPVPKVGKRKRSLPLDGELPNPISPPSGCPFHPRCPLATSQCKTQVPESRIVAGSHMVRCHHA